MGSIVVLAVVMTGRSCASPRVVIFPVVAVGFDGAGANPFTVAVFYLIVDEDACRAKGLFVFGGRAKIVQVVDAMSLSVKESDVSHFQSGNPGCTSPAFQLRCAARWEKTAGVRR